TPAPGPPSSWGAASRAARSSARPIRKGWRSSSERFPGPIFWHPSARSWESTTRSRIRPRSAGRSALWTGAPSRSRSCSPSTRNANPRREVELGGSRARCQGEAWASLSGYEEYLHVADDHLRGAGADVVCRHQPSGGQGKEGQEGRGRLRDVRVLQG